MRILGIDPGLARTGFGLIEVVAGAHPRFLDAGCITTPAGLSLPSRLVILADDLAALLAEAHPDELALEDLYFGTNVTTGLTVAHARGIVLLQAERQGVSVTTYAPASVKLAVTSSGAADKQQMQDAVQMLLRLADVPKPDDAADALAIALCHTFKIQVPTLTVL